ncbi:GTP pyrophosphokinase family protein [uncultured Ruminococcus sp.]|uniref:GTP pyrophosphokinase n=1 Tax=uncultured Ruminococcus sp. TaxID=165186 RepID=UPI0029306A36|nr:GTP pyrophosphokinase family protein [uncultured Ruminococcus sp.]
MTSQDRQFYGIYADKLIQIAAMLEEEINKMLDSISTDPELAPAEHIKCRIKSSDSLKEKLRKNDLPETAEAGLKNLSDLVGARVITHFVGDIYDVLRLIEANNSWKVIKIKDYIANMKPNGYRSLHVLMTVPFGVGGIDTIDTEIQLRTIAMDCWASLEHQLKYKKNIRNTALIEGELKRCADEMASTDLSMQTIRDLIRKE